jgi:hypothetical protein
VTDPIVITEPGVYDMSNEDYHADPVPGGSLSSTGARRLLPPGCPAQFAYDREHPPESKPHFDMGHIAHMLVLGVGAECQVIDAPTWQTKAARVERDEARAAGLVPLLAHQYAECEAMADALRRHPLASLLFNPDHGRPEQSLFWVDEPTGIWCRARLDWLPDRIPGMRMIIPDYKTADAVDIDALVRACASHGYHQQDSWYRAAVQALGLAGDDVRFVLVFQSKTPPYLVTIVEMDHVAQRLGHQLNRQALQIYQHCRDTRSWPAHADDVVQLRLPAWYENAMGANEL